MALPTVPPIRLSDLQTYFTAPGSTGLTDFYAGGTYVPLGTRNGANVLIPTSGNISLLDFLGAIKPLQTALVTVQDDTGGPTGITGFSSFFGLGSVSPTNWVVSGSAFTAIEWTVTGHTTFAVAGTQPNSGWTKVFINGRQYNRVDAAYDTISGTEWDWAEPSNPFGPNGEVDQVVFY